MPVMPAPLRDVPMMRFMCLVLAASFAWGAGVSLSHAEANPFERGWTLDAEASELRFISLKKGTIAETNHFADIQGEIDEIGNATVRIVLNSVETYADIRNVRMRFLFFETFIHPVATISVKIDRGSLNDLPQKRRKIVPMNYTLSLHGKEVRRSARFSLFLIDENHVSVANTDPIFVGVTDFELQEGLARLEQAAQVDISPMAIVSFDFSFARNPEASPETDAVSGADASKSASAAAPRIRDWNADDPDPQTCIARLLTLGRLDSVRFDTQGARIAQDSLPLLQAYADAMVRCPTIRIGVMGLIAPGEQGTTGLSVQRSQAVIRYLWSRGVQRSRLLPGDGGMVTAETAPTGGGRVLIRVLD